MNQTVWKYKSGDTKSIFGRPYTYNGTKWVPDEGVKTDNKGKEKVGANVSPKEADNFLKENGLEHIDMLSTKSVRRLFEHHGIDWKAQSPKERLNELIKIYGTGSGTKKEEKPKEEKPKEEKKRTILDADEEDAKEIHAKVQEAIQQGVTDDPTYDKLASKVLKDLKPMQVKALVDYAEDSFFLNDMLRRPDHGFEEGSETKKATKNIALIDEAFKNIPPIGSRLEVHRETILPADVFSKLAVGKGYKDKGFASTSTDKEVTEAFHEVAVDSRWDKDIVCTMKISIPKEAKVLPIAPIAEEMFFGFQKEILINRDSTYKISKITKKGYEAEIHLELIV